MIQGKTNCLSTLTTHQISRTDKTANTAIHFNFSYIFYPILLTLVCLSLALCYQVRFYKHENAILQENLTTRNVTVATLINERNEHINRINALQQQLEYYSSMYEILVPGETIYDVPVPKVRIADTETSITVYGLPPTVFQAKVADTRSMAPTLTEGMIVLLDSNVKIAELQIGDIIAFKNPDNPDIHIIHRIVSIDVDGLGWYCMTKGDNPHCSIDCWKIRPENIVAVYVGNIG